MIEPKPQASPYDSCHHKDTSLGDTFGGLGVCDEVREEDARALRLARAPAFPNRGTTSARAKPHTHDTELAAVWRRAAGYAEAMTEQATGRSSTHESTHDKP